MTTLLRQVCNSCSYSGWINSQVCNFCGGLGFLRKSKGGFEPENYVQRNAIIIQMRLAGFSYPQIREKFPELSNSRLGQIFDIWKSTHKQKRSVA